MGNYSIRGSGTNTAGTTLLYTVNGPTILHRLDLFEVIVGANVTSDSAYDASVKRVTAENGTPGGTAIIPERNDLADPAADSNAVSDPSGEPTYTAGADVIVFPGHLRGTILWSPAPGREIRSPAIADNGFGFLINSVVTAFNQVVGMRYAE